MKRLWMFLLVLVVLVLTACSSETGENKVQPAKLTDKEEVLLTTLTNTSFMFDYDVTSDVSEVRVWAEKYEAGKLVDEHVVDLMTEATEKTGSIVIATIAHSSDDTGISSLSNEFYKNADVDTEALVDYDFVYVYKMMVE